MPSRLVLLANNPTERETTDISNAVTAAGGAWWHWYQQAWLIHDPLSRDVTFWRNHLSPHRSCNFMILDTDGRHWTGVSEPAHYDWLYQYWHPVGRR